MKTAGRAANFNRLLGGSSQEHALLSSFRHLIQSHLFGRGTSIIRK